MMSSSPSQATSEIPVPNTTPDSTTPPSIPPLQSSLPKINPLHKKPQKSLLVKESQIEGEGDDEQEEVGTEQIEIDVDMESVFKRETKVVGVKESEVVEVKTQVELDVVGEQLEQKEGEQIVGDVSRGTEKIMVEPREEAIEGSSSVAVETPEAPGQQPGSSVAGEGEMGGVGDVEEIAEKETDQVQEHGSF
ncbi:hypothetical protein A4A49_15087 [Nicotiana attenuata]|uniref:Uncharacterized protein n=1 Tax=Nicotiana attenuata TaxID=49451 RepID=A0A314LDA6_NICAT|nr:hypothetical protein A4A49_15087 [Nicotiana attenuata]